MELEENVATYSANSNELNYYVEQLNDDTLSPDDIDAKYENTESNNCDISETNLYRNQAENNEFKKTVCQEYELEEKPKILVQRVFHKSNNDIVEPKLDYVIAHSKSEITKHVFGGLFNTKYYPYAPENYCKKHAPDLFEFEDESLPKIGDKFESLESFRLYVDGKAREWKYYLKCADSHRKNGKDTFVYKCVFARAKNYIPKVNGLRERTRRVPLHDCPCRVLVKAVPLGAKDLTVVYVCNHHDHPLTDDYFQKLQHGRRLHPSVKEELMDVLSLNVEREVAKKYFERMTGYSMHNGFFSNLLFSMKKNNIKRQFSVERLKELSRKIEKIREDILHEGESVDNPVLPEDSTFNDSHSTKIVEVLNVLNSVSAPKRTPVKRVKKRDVINDPNIKRARGRKRQIEDSIEEFIEGANNKSRLERRLQQLNNDEKTLQNVKYLQDSVKTDINLLHNDQELAKQNSDRIPSEKEHESNILEDKVIETVLETQGGVVESSQCESEILYENEVTVENDAPAENDTQYIMYENNHLLGGNNISYCIEFEHDGESSDRNEFILLENLENMPLQIRATDLATVSINPEEMNPNVPNTQEKPNESTADDVTANIHSNMEIVDKLSNSALTFENGDVFEVIETNNKNILPDRKFVRNVIFNKDKGSKVESVSKNKMENKSNRTLHGTKQFGRKKGRLPKIKHELELDHAYDQQTVIKSEFGIDMDDLDDSDHYLIVVNSDSDKSDTNISSSEDDNESNSFKAAEITYKKSEREKIESDIRKLRQLKNILKRDVQKLFHVKNELLEDINKAREVLVKMEVES